METAHVHTAGGNGGHAEGRGRDDAAVERELWRAEGAPSADTPEEGTPQVALTDSGDMGPAVVEDASPSALPAFAHSEDGARDVSSAVPSEAHAQSAAEGASDGSAPSEECPAVAIAVEDSPLGREAPVHLFMRKPAGGMMLAVAEGHDLEAPREATEDDVRRFQGDPPMLTTAFFHDAHYHRTQALQQIFMERRRRLLMGLLVIDAISAVILVILNFARAFNQVETIPFLLYSCANFLNDIFGLTALVTENTRMLGFFIVFAGIGMVFSTVIAFSPLVFLHLGIFLISLQVRIQVSRLEMFRSHA